MKLQTSVTPDRSPFSIDLGSRVLTLGSCFADSMGARMTACGMNVCINPFGTLYNPVSIAGALKRLESARPFGPEDCVHLGAGSALTGSFRHHTSFARRSAEEFLEVANSALESASAAWRICDTLMVTLGTSWVWEHDGMVVANCLKRDAREFVHRRLSVDEVTEALEDIVRIAGARRIVWTVSPIRHLWDGAHSNSLSKAILLIALDRVLTGAGMDNYYFPAYEIVLDELRDYRFYAEDMTHPTAVAVGCVWEKFCDALILSSCREAMTRAEKASRAAAHRPLFGKGD